MESVRLPSRLAEISVGIRTLVWDSKLRVRLLREITLIRSVHSPPTRPSVVVFWLVLSLATRWREPSSSEEITCTTFLNTTDTRRDTRTWLLTCLRASSVLRLVTTLPLASAAHWVRLFASMFWKSARRTRKVVSSLSSSDWLYDTLRIHNKVNYTICCYFVFYIIVQNMG